MSQHYYLMSSLPFLLLETDSELEYSEFLDRCGQWLSTSEFESLEQAVLIPPKTQLSNTHDVLLQWFMFETSLRNELVRVRAQKSGIDIFPFIRVSNTTTLNEATIRNALQSEDPLLVEEALDRTRWTFIDELSVGHFFDLTSVLLYALRLQIMLRRQLRTRDRGSLSFENQFESISSQIRV